MMKERSIGVTIYGTLYLLFAALLVPDVITHLIVLTYALLTINAPVAGGEPSGVAMVLITVLGLCVLATPTLLMAILGIGLLKLLNKTRKLMLGVNALLIIFIVSYLCAMTQPGKFPTQPSLFYKIVHISALVVMASSFIFFTRPTVKEQFKK
jgi:hypothetical protein